MTHDEMEAAVHRYVSGFANGDAASLADLFAEEATIEDPVGSQVTSGNAAIVEHFRKAVASGSRIELSGPVRTAADHAAFPFEARIGDSIRVHVIDTFRFDHAGKVIEMRAYWSPENIELAEAGP